jgi:hypothetical protein
MQASKVVARPKILLVGPLSLSATARAGTPLPHL